MIKRKKIKKPPERNWISLSVILIIVVLFLQSYNPIPLTDFFYLTYFLFLWSLILVYALGNTLREVPDFELKKRFLKIKKIEVYESWYSLTAIGLISLSVVIIIALNCGEAWGIAVFGVLFGFLCLWIRDILNKKRGKS